MRNRTRPFLGVMVSALILPVAMSCMRKEATTTTTETALSSSATAAALPVETVGTAPVTDSTATTVPATAPAATAGIATADGEAAGVTATIKELKRASGGTISLKLVITNGSGKRLNTGYDFADPDNSVRDFNSIGGVQLIDPVGKKKYFVARDSEGKCVCSQGLKDLEPGESVNVWAKFAAPPADVQNVSVIVPHFSPMDDVPISAP